MPAATHSPVVINSSSPPITPPSIPESNDRPVSSSSASLLLPSAFVRPRAAGLKTGSRAQHVPDGVNMGFASAGSLVKSNHFATAELDRDVGLGGEGEAIKPKKGQGSKEKQIETAGTSKLTRPRKRRKTEEAVKDVAVVAAASPSERLHVFRHHAVGGDVGTTNATPTKASPGVDLPTIRTRTPTVTLSEYAFKVGESPGPVQQRKKTTKVRNAATKKADAGLDKPVKKSRKRKAKSASFILNSDEPDDDGTVLQAPEEARGGGQETKSDAPARSKGFGAFAFGREEHHLEVDASISAEVEQLDVPVTEETSAHFASRESQGLVPKVTAPNTIEAPYVAPILPRELSAETPGELPGPIHHAAAKRRIGWTPPKDTDTIHAPLDLSPAPSHEDAFPNSPPKQHLSTVLSGFGYMSDINSATPSMRDVRLEAATKRRRIELADSSTNTAAAGQQRQVTEHSAVTKPTKEKKPKKPAKKVQTITALATAAFQPPQQPSRQPDTVVSELFTADKDKPPPLPQETVMPAAGTRPASKAKKLRKPRTKPTAVADDNTVENSKPKARTKAKPKTAKVKFNEADHKPKLFSPGHATAQFDKQDFVFGTSSQLAVDEDAAFIRDMQAAVRESEMMLQPDTSASLSPQKQGTQAIASPPSWKSCVRVPTAPHGTNLSVGQADKEHWCTSSRDRNGGVVKIPPINSLSGPRRSLARTSDVAAAPSGLASSGVVFKSRGADDVPCIPHAEAREGTFGVPQGTEGPIVPPIQANSLATGLQTSPSPLELPPSSPANDANDRDDNDDDTWMLLGSDDSIAAPVLPHPGNEVTDIVVNDDGSPAPAKDNRKIGPPLPQSVMPMRSPLRLLDRNLPVLASPYSTKARTKPAKNVSPPADTAAAKAVPLGQQSKSSPPRKRGRPPKAAAAITAELQHQSNNATVASQPAAATEFIDIDVISDSDAPVTPSPPRRRAKSLSPAVTPLKLTPVKARELEAKAPAVVVPTLKSGDSHWQSVRAATFTRITQAVKAGPRTDNSDKPSWWQKILLYDPIVLEDLTAWLNERGMKVEVKKQNPRPKKKGRKKKDDAEIAEEPEWEVVEEPLQPWMVQKWCEEMSVCCLWNGGLRGGVKTAY
ncbi:5'-flap endonuclease [Saxophila tyrrhenica]|uniref:Structure-specific endonuclease subunit SLX4 n=1 Tax=Saxophila tyrrhenica TaxID=1690608 RepID=A0AAV9NTF5_9PEZI|nr:5'-flap endonuclease [Saxophila tyrrhenica]